MTRFISEISRRNILKTGLALTALSVMPPFISRAFSASPNDLKLGESRPFVFDDLKKMAKAISEKPFEPYFTSAEDKQILNKIDYDAYQLIEFKKENALWHDKPKTDTVRFFHMWQGFQRAIKIHVLDKGQASEVLYNPDLYSMPDTHPAKNFKGQGFAGFRVMDGTQDRDWLAFLGASYFRSSGELDQYGISARGLAIDTGLPTPEEFPVFTQFWFDNLEEEKGTFLVYALLESESVTGAYQFRISRHKNVVMDILCDLYARSDIKRVGIAPFSSMFWYSETNRCMAVDWRPEIHDSDGLAIWTGDGERLWRPLNNPPRVVTSSFKDNNPKGFGVLQRDRNFENYQDDGVFYEKRPSVWVEPIGTWGEGTVQLLEIPTIDEIHDNIAVYWTPKDPFKAKEHRQFHYKLYWNDVEPFLPAVGQTVSSRIGMGGVPGRTRPKGVYKFSIDFEGGLLQPLTKQDAVKPIISLSHGKVSGEYALKVVGTNRWRAIFDIDTLGQPDPVEIRLYLALGDKTLTETWLYQYHPVSDQNECLVVQ